MICKVSFPGMSRISLTFEHLLKTIEPDLKSKLINLTNVRKELVKVYNPSLPINEIDRINDTYCSLLIEIIPILSKAKCKPPKFAWITAMLSLDKKVESK